MIPSGESEERSRGTGLREALGRFAPALVAGGLYLLAVVSVLFLPFVTASAGGWEATATGADLVAGSELGLVFIVRALRAPPREGSASPS